MAVGKKSQFLQGTGRNKDLNTWISPQGCLTVFTTWQLTAATVSNPKEKVWNFIFCGPTLKSHSHVCALFCSLEESLSPACIEGRGNENPLLEGSKAVSRDVCTLNQNTHEISLLTSLTGLCLLYFCRIAKDKAILRTWIEFTSQGS